MAKFEKGDPRINRQGAGTKEELVKNWRAHNPAGTKYRCAKVLGISETTVRKWWDK